MKDEGESLAKQPVVTHRRAGGNTFVDRDLSAAFTAVYRALSAIGSALYVDEI